MYNVVIYGGIPPDHVALIVAVSPSTTGFGNIDMPADIAEAVWDIPAGTLCECTRYAPQLTARAAIRVATRNILFFICPHVRTEKATSILEDLYLSLGKKTTLMVLQ